MQCNILGSNSVKNKQYSNDHAERDSPLQVKLIKFLGLKNYFMDKFVFRRKPSKYQLAKRQNNNIILYPKEYKPPSKLTAQVELIESGSHSIPVLILKHLKPVSDILIIYSHGNSSDLSQSIIFLENLALTYGVNVLGYDYSGYGQSRVPVIGQQTIVKDLELVISWVKTPLHKIVLWGFSLGSYPTVCNASKFKVGGMVLHCPIASVNCMFEQNLNTKTKFKQDHFSNLDRISSVKCWTFIVHTLEDEIIPVVHGRLLFQKFSQINGKDKIWFLQVGQAKHNGLHKFFISRQSNDIKQQFSSFVRRVQHQITKIQLKKQQPQQCLIRLHNRYKIVQAQLVQQQTCQQQYQLLAICQTTQKFNPGRKFIQKRTIIPRCFD